MTNTPLHPRTKRFVLDIIEANTRRPRAWIDVALAKWEAGSQPEPCTEEMKGKGYGLATDCKCRGCFERGCLAYFSQVRSRGIA